MLKNENQKRPGLTQKLKNAVENISVDVFGYEKKITRNVVQYLNKAARDHSIPYEQLFARIIKQNVTIRVFLHHNGRQLKEIRVKELVHFFAGQEAADLLGMESKVIESVGKYLDELSKDNEIPLKMLHVRISGSGKKAVVEVYNEHQFIRNIPIKDLVKFFKP